MQVHRSPFIRIYFYEEQSLLESIWTAESVEMTPELIKDEYKRRFALIERYNPTRLLNNTHNFYYRIPPDCQEWISNNVLDKYHQYGVQKIAYIISDDIIAQISIEQLIQEKPDREYEIRYFDSREEALDWLVPEEPVLA